MNTTSTASGIYAIVNRVNGKRYVGSAVNFKKRCQNHYYYLNKGTHHCNHLQAAWNKYGERAFEFAILEFITVPFLIDAEQQYLDANKDGYNIAKCAEASGRGIKRSAEMREKLSRARKNLSPETIAKLAAAQRGKKYSLESRAKMSAAQRGRKQSAETIEKRAAANRGKKRSPESIAKMSAVVWQGRKHTPESLAKMSAAQMGKKQSPETVAKRAASNRGKKRSQETRDRMSAAARARKTKPMESQDGKELERGNVSAGNAAQAEVANGTL